jgi:HicB family
MGTLTIRLPDEKHEKLRQLAIRRKISINKLVEELSTIALTDFDAETRFRARTALGSRQEGLHLLDRLDHGTTAGEKSSPKRKGQRRS